MTDFHSSAPHIHDVVHFSKLDEMDMGLVGEDAPAFKGKFLWQDDTKGEVGVWHIGRGRWRLAMPHDEFFWLMTGDADYTADDGKKINIKKNNGVFVPAGFQGMVAVKEPMLMSYMLSQQKPLPDDSKELKFFSPLDLAMADLADWGAVPTMIEGVSKTSGRLLHRTGRDTECGFWTCTSGRWHCHVTRDEYCHFLEGRATYVCDDTGEQIEIMPDTLAFFPKDWRGVCTVHELVKKVYMIL